MTKEELIKQIKDSIIRGQLAPGQRIVELQLAKDLQISRNKVREAIRALEQEGFVDIVPNTGAVVREISQKDIVQIYDLMSVLEGLSMRIATPIINQATIDRIEKLVEQVEEAEDDPFLMSQRNYEFHRFLTELAGNERLSQFMENIRLHTYRMRLQTFYLDDQKKATLQEHRQILAEIKNRNAEAVEKLIRQHYQDAKERLIKIDLQTY